MTNSLDNLTIKDDYLRDVLEGRAILLQDGALGTILQAQGIADKGVNPQLANLNHPDAVMAIHQAYIAAGAQMITTNTFSANAKDLGGESVVVEVIAAGVELARSSGAHYVAGNIGPLGELLEPYGDLSFEEAYGRFAAQVKIMVNSGCDLFALETFTDLEEARAAIKAARDHSSLPIFATMSFAAGGRTFMGVSPEDAARELSAAGAHAVGMNCSLGPAEILPVAQAMKPHLSCPMIVRPNAGQPQLEEGKTVYDITPELFAEGMGPVLDCGATIVGGCCGTTPDHIRALAAVVQER